MNEKKPTTPAILTCPDCNVKFRGPARARLLGMHRHHNHGYVGISKSSVTARAKRASKQRESPPVCPQCGKTFKNGAGLAGHLSKAHGVSGTANPYRTKNRQLAKAANTNGKATPAILTCPDCNVKFRGPIRARLLGMHRHHNHGYVGISRSAIQAREKRTEFSNNEALAKGAFTNGNSPSPAHQPQQDEIDAYILGHTVASVQALIAHTAERDGISAELLTHRCAAILQGAALRQRGRPRRAM